MPLIARRLSTATSADRLELFESGRVSDHGRHEELLEHSAPSTGASPRRS
ncbi:hypothetical protein [Streptomyces sp. NPDC006267]